jgi:hypothetical protein
VKQHPREPIVRRAALDLSDFALKLREKNDLSYIEYLGILNEEIARVLKYALRAERHPDDPDKPAGIE